MGRYSKFSDLNEVEIFNRDKVENVEYPKMTFIIDYLCLKGGGIKDIHNQIMKEQSKRNSDGYLRTGCFFDKNGNIQQRTLFGHIAHLAFQESFIIKFGNIIIDQNTTKKDLDTHDWRTIYNNNSTLQIIGFKEKTGILKNEKNSSAESVATTKEEKIEHNKNREEQSHFFSDNNTYKSPEEEEFEKPYTEGHKTSVFINRYERNRYARNECIKHYGAKCSVCNFDFEQRYGVIGKGFIHVHHLKPLSTLDKKYNVDPVEDLRPVCPNCHAMLHIKNPPFMIEELVKLIEPNK